MDIIAPKTVKVLKDLSKSEYIAYEDVVDEYKQRLNELVDLGYATQYTIQHPTMAEGFLLLICKINTAGTVYIKDYLKQRRRENCRFWIPAIVSIVALIGGYREELAWLLQAIMQLWK